MGVALAKPTAEVKTAAVKTLDETDLNMTYLYELKMGMLRCGA